MDPTKLSPALADRVEQAAPGEVLDVVVELHRRLIEATRGTTVEERIAPVRDAFAAEARPVEDEIRRLDGEVLGSAWINQTLRARVPVEGIGRLAGLDEVVALDLPRRLAPG